MCLFPQTNNIFDGLFMATCQSGRGYRSAQSVEHVGQLSAERRRLWRRSAALIGYRSTNVLAIIYSCPGSRGEFTLRYTDHWLIGPLPRGCPKN